MEEESSSFFQLFCSFNLYKKILRDTFCVVQIILTFFQIFEYFSNFVTIFLDFKIFLLFLEVFDHAAARLVILLGLNQAPFCFLFTYSIFITKFPDFYDFLLFFSSLKVFDHAAARLVILLGLNYALFAFFLYSLNSTEFRIQSLKVI